MGEWRDGRLADACASIDYGLTASAKEQPVGPKFLRITDIVSSTLNWKDVPYTSVSEKDRKKYRLDHGDIVIARTGATTGESRFIQNPPETVFASYLVRLKINADNDPRFISYWLKSPFFWNYLRGVLGDKSAQPNASASTMTQAPMRIPPDRDEQYAIASTLGALDDKIELNRLTNETLEAMARAIFKDWFVDFGPTRAKLEGRPPYLAPDLWSLFPDRLDDETGVPDGWELSEIGKEVEAVGGGTPSTKESSFWNNGTHYWATPKDMSKLSDPILLETERKITDSGLARISSGLLPVGTVLLSSRAPIGYLAIAEVPVAVNQGFIAMRCTKRLSSVFVILWCYEKLDYIKSISGGSTFAEINKKVFRPIPVTVPTQEVSAAFDNIVVPLYADIAENVREARSVAATRDLLLPKLMSGEIRLREAEKIAGEAL